MCAAVLPESDGKAVKGRHVWVLAEFSENLNVLGPFHDSAFQPLEWKLGPETPASSSLRPVAEQGPRPPQAGQGCPGHALCDAGADSRPSYAHGGAGGALPQPLLGVSWSHRPAAGPL